MRTIEINPKITTVHDEILDCSRSLAFAPLSDECPKFLPGQFMRSSGIDCTKYSRCSFVIVHIGRFFCVISSSRFFRSCSRFGNQISWHEQMSGLSAGGRGGRCHIAGATAPASGRILTDNVDHAHSVFNWLHHFFGDPLQLVVLQVERFQRVQILKRERRQRGYAGINICNINTVRWHDFGAVGAPSAPGAPELAARPTYSFFCRLRKVMESP